MNRGQKRPGGQQAPPSSTERRILRGHKAVVTGASSGIGRGVALALARAGADVAINFAHNEGEATQVADAVRDHGVQALVHQADVSDEAQVVDMFDRVREEWGTFHILVSNAGIQADAPFVEMTLAQWQTVLDVNLTGQFLCVREAVREFKRRGVEPDTSCAAGKIICMSSVHEVIPWAGHVNYAASKGGVMLLMKSVAQEVARDRIRVNSVAPGAVRTPINREAWETPEALEKLLTLIPYQRVGEVEDIGRAVVWLASDDSDYVTGTTLVIDGGMTLFPGFAGGAG